MSKVTQQGHLMTKPPCGRAGDKGMGGEGTGHGAATSPLQADLGGLSGVGRPHPGKYPPSTGILSSVFLSPGREGVVEPKAQARQMVSICSHCAWSVPDS